VPFQSFYSSIAHGFCFVPLARDQDINIYRKTPSWGTEDGSHSEKGQLLIVTEGPIWSTNDKVMQCTLFITKIYLMGPELWKKCTNNNYMWLRFFHLPWDLCQTTSKCSWSWSPKIDPSISNPGRWCSRHHWPAASDHRSTNVNLDDTCRAGDFAISQKLQRDSMTCSCWDSMHI
jgi:hypothetical protein